MTAAAVEPEDQGLALMAALSAGGQTGQTGGEALRELITETGRASGKLRPSRSSPAPAAGAPTS